MTATAIIATIGNGAAFRRGRDFAAWLGVVPEEHSTGGKQTLWEIPRRGNSTCECCSCRGQSCDATQDETVIRVDRMAGTAHGTNSS